MSLSVQFRTVIKTLSPVAVYFYNLNYITVYQLNDFFLAYYEVRRQLRC